MAQLHAMDSASMHFDGERAAILDRYISLHSHRDQLRQAIRRRSSPSPPPLSIQTSMQTTTATSPDMSASEPTSASPSPTLEGHNFSPLSAPAFALPKPVTSRKTSSRSPSKIAPIPEENCLDSFEQATTIDESEIKLENVNFEIKSTLTELLNREEVRHDGKMRLLIQTKLMDAELELKRQRRRRSSTPRIVLTPTEGNEGC